MNPIFLSLFLITSGLSVFAQTDTLSIFFDVDSDEVSKDQRGLLQKLAMSNFIVLIEGHCDTTGSIGYNQMLAQRRVDNVKAFTEKTQINRTQIIGEKVASQSKNYSAEKFRRVDIVYSKSEEERHAQIDDAPRDEPIIIGGTPEVEKIIHSFENFLTDSTTKEEVIQLSILFYSNSGMYTTESEPELQALFDFLHYNPDIDIHIRGHICCVKFMDWDDISEKRAKTVYTFLKDRSISPRRMTYAGYGTSVPFKSPEVTEEDRKLNRRVDIVFSKKK